MRVVGFVVSHPKQSYLVSIVLLWGLGILGVLVWCQLSGGDCFICEYDYYKTSPICSNLPDLTFYVKLVNQCPTTIFMGAAGPTRVLPREGNKWHLLPQESITITIPDTWKHTQGTHLVGPRFWARTGCKYNIPHNKAQCETGDCGNYYDCSQENLAGKAPTSLAEFCFVCGDGLTYYDVSLVDGYSVSVDIIPGPHSPERPGDPGNAYWCKADLCKKEVDLRSSCPTDFLLFSDNISSYNPPDPIHKIACFSNCGKYAYPTAPSADCKDSDPQCASWREYCCQSFTYGKKCDKDSQCDDGGACWGGTCQCKAYYRHPPCSPDICTNPGLDAQPTAGNCSDCIGDDMIHRVCPRAYTWPNDPQTYSCDATSYTVIFCPGGTLEPITASTQIPLCSSLDPHRYDWPKAKTDCGVHHGNFLCAVTISQGSWGCDVDRGGCNTQICQFG